MASDELVFALLQRYIRSHPSTNLWCLDGLPRRKSQATMLDSMLACSAAVFCLNVPEAELRNRIHARWIHVQSGRTYHATYNPPKEPGIDDLSGEALVRRCDDNDLAFSIRYADYLTHLPSLQNHYKSRLRIVDGCNSAGIYAKIVEALLPKKELLA